MTDPVARDSLLRRWTHSHEEDSEGRMVFRPADHEFPPSRGRVTYDLSAHGALSGAAPGPTDRPADTAGTWELQDDGRTLVLRVEGQAEQRLQIESLEDDRMVVRR
jgi:hypothetical protein